MYAQPVKNMTRSDLAKALDNVLRKLHMKLYKLITERVLQLYCAYTV